MELELFVPLEELNTSHTNKLVTCQGIVKELSPDYKDDNYRFIQSVIIQGLKKNHQEIGVQRDVEVILLENNSVFLSLGDKIQITGVLEVKNAQDSRTRNMVLVAKNIKKLNDDIDLTQQEITKIRTIAQQPLVQQDLASYTFDNALFIEDDIKLIGTVLLFCAALPKLVEKRIHCNLSLLIVGTSGTYKTTYLQALKELLPNKTVQFSQKSEGRFVTYNSRHKKGGKFCKKAGLADLAKNGILLIDNLEELKPYRLSKLGETFIEILRKSSIIAAVHTRGRNYYEKESVYENLQFPGKNNLLGKFDIVLVTTNRPDKKTDNYETIRITGEQNIDIRTIFSKDLLRKYIIYAKKNYDPILTKEAGDQLNEFKEEMLKINKEEKKERKINQQNLIKVLVMLSKAYARIALKNETTVKDVQKIIGIYKKSLKNLDLI